MDEIDQAQQNDELFRRNALNKHFGRSPEYLLRKGVLPNRSRTVHGAGPGSGPRLCTDCGDKIDAGRLEARPGATRCIDCQAKHERKLKAGGLA